MYAIRSYYALGFPVLTGADARDAGADAAGIVEAISALQKAEDVDAFYLYVVNEYSYNFV